MGRANSPPAGLSHDRPFPPDCAARFACIKPLAEGGFGAVWLAEDRRLERRVAIKLLLREVLEDPEAVRRFDAEARITASLHHPHIVRVLDHGAEYGIPWIAYELIEGGSLRAALQAGRLDLAGALNATIQVAGALDAAHARGVVHRDIKPENVLEAEPGRYKVTDFGIARHGDSGVKTKTGVIMGTPSYIAPELVAGEVSTPASDLYALAVMLFELVIGRPPFEDANPIAVLERHLRSVPPVASALASGVPPALDALLARGLAKDPRERPRSGAAFAAELETILERAAGAPLSVAGTGAVREPPRRSGRMAALAVAGALLAAAAFLARPRPVPPPEPRAGSPSQRPAASPPAAPDPFAADFQSDLEALFREQNTVLVYVNSHIKEMNDPAHGAAVQTAQLLVHLRRLLRTCREHGADPLRLAGAAESCLAAVDQLYRKLHAELFFASLAGTRVPRELDALNREVADDHWHPNGSGFKSLLQPSLDGLCGTSRRSPVEVRMKAESVFVEWMDRHVPPGARPLTPVEAIALISIAIQHDAFTPFVEGPPEVTRDVLPGVIPRLIEAVTVLQGERPGRPLVGEGVYLLTMACSAVNSAAQLAAQPQRDPARRLALFRAEKLLLLSICRSYRQTLRGPVPEEIVKNLSTVPGLDADDRKFLDDLRRDLTRR